MRANPGLIAALLISLASLLLEGHAHGDTEPRARTQVEANAHGLSLSLRLQRTTYPLNAIVPALVTLQNRTNRVVRYGDSLDLAPTIDTVPSHCVAASPTRVLRGSLLDSCLGLTNAYSFQDSAPGTGNPGLIRSIAPHRVITEHLLFVARSSHVRAVALLHGEAMTPGIATPTLMLTLLPGQKPTVRVAVGARGWVRVTSAEHREGRLLATSLFACLSNGGYVREGLVTAVGWHAGRNGAVWLNLHPMCSARLVVRIAAGWLDEPATIVQYVRKRQ